MVNLDSLIRENIKRLKPYSSARDEFSGKEGIFLDANENPIGSVGGGDSFNRYPDPQQRSLRERIAELRNVKSSQIFLGNGSDEAIDLMIRAFCEPGRDKILIFPPTYGMYEVCAAVNDVGIMRVNLTEAFDINLQAVLEKITQEKAIKLIYICSPNNPTGNSMGRNNIGEVLRQFKGIVIIDEAYIDFSHGTSWVSQIKTYNNLVIFHTFSKVWGLAGIRLGAAFADETVITVLNRIKYPYNVNAVTQKIALNALNNIEQHNTMVNTILQQRTRLVQQLKKISFVNKVFPSDANFILVQFDRTEEIFNYLIKKQIIVRDRRTAPLCADCLRITVGTKEENKILINALKNFDNHDSGV